MKRFILHTAYFIFTLLLINTILYFTGKKLYFGNYAFHSLNYTSYILSDSHGQALNDYAEKCGIYNFSHGSDSYYDMYRKMLYLIRNTKVDTIYLSADDHTLSPYRDKNNNMDRSVIYSSSEEFESYYEYIKQKYIKHYLAIFRPEIGAIIKNHKYFAATKQEVSWESMSKKDRIKNSEKRARTHLPEKGSSSKLERSLIDIINVCRSNEIELIGIKLPLAKEYIEAMDGRTFKADVILRENGCDVYDFTNMFIDNSEYFANQDHLNKAGAKEFTDKVFKEFTSRYKKLP